jgi:hypothetical protein
METKLVPETSENLHIMTWLFAREKFIGFGKRLLDLFKGKRPLIICKNSEKLRTI